MGDLLSISDLRKVTGQPSHVINHAVRSYGPEPSGRVGITRVWRREDLPAILDALKKTAVHSTNRSRRAAGGGK